MDGDLHIALQDATGNRPGVSDDFPGLHRLAALLIVQNRLRCRFAQSPTALLCASASVTAEDDSYTRVAARYRVLP
jgi:hypothetical protein